MHGKRTRRPGRELQGAARPVVRCHGGTVKRARRVDGRDDLREIHVEPSGWGDVAVTLPGGRACGTCGAICTADGRALSNTLTATVKGLAALADRIGGAADGGAGMRREAEGPAASDRSMTGRELLLGSSFGLSRGQGFRFWRSLTGGPARGGRCGVPWPGSGGFSRRCSMRATKSTTGCRSGTAGLSTRRTSTSSGSGWCLGCSPRAAAARWRATAAAIAEAPAGVSHMPDGIGAQLFEAAAVSVTEPVLRPANVAIRGPRRARRRYAPACARSSFVRSWGILRYLV